MYSLLSPWLQLDIILTSFDGFQSMFCPDHRPEVDIYTGPFVMKSIACLIGQNSFNRFKFFLPGRMRTDGDASSHPDMNFTRVAAWQFPTSVADALRAFPSSFPQGK